MIAFCHSCFLSKSRLATEDESTEEVSKERVIQSLLSTPKRIKNFRLEDGYLLWSKESTLDVDDWDTIIYKWTFKQSFKEWAPDLEIDTFGLKEKVTFFEWINHVYPLTPFPKKPVLKVFEAIEITSPLDVLKKKLAKFNLPDLDSLIESSDLHSNVLKAVQENTPNGLELSSLLSEVHDMFANFYQSKGGVEQKRANIKKARLETEKYNTKVMEQYENDLLRYTRMSDACKHAFDLWHSMQPCYSLNEANKIANELYTI